MRSAQAIAVWLFELLDLDGALTGDILEERARGRSSIWYWRQVLVAVWAGIWRAVRRHKLCALRAVATGCAIEWLIIFLWNRWGPDLSIYLVGNWIFQFSAVVVTQVATGWVVARTHRAHPIPMVLAFLIFFLLWDVVANFAWIRMAFVDSMHQSRFRPYLAMYVMNMFTAAASIPLGGILAARSRRYTV
jgi:hypothetical protein